MKKILVGYDKSPGSENALSLAIELAEDRELELVILFVRSRYDKNFIKDNELDEAEIKERVKDMMKEAVKTVIRSNIKVEGVILKGDIAQKIMDYSEEKDVDLLIIGATGIGDFGRYKLGSIAEKLAHYSTKPVLIVR